MDALARQLVAFDTRISEEIAEHLVARARRLEARHNQDDIRAAEKAERFLLLADLIRRERTIARARDDSRSNVADLQSAAAWTAR